MSLPSEDTLSTTESLKVTQFIDTLYLDDPNDTDLNSLLETYSSTELAEYTKLMKKAVKISETKEVPLYDKETMTRINKILSLCDTDADSERAKSTLMGDSDHNYNKVSFEVNLTDEERTIKLAEIASRKRKNEETFMINNPKNIKLSEKPRAKHIHDWESSHQRGYAIHIEGAGYAKGAFNDMIRDIREDIGTVLGIMERDESATLILDEEKYRQKVIEIINKSDKKLTAKPALYRYPIIKLWMNSRAIHNDWSEVVAELKAFNFKNYTDKEFTFWKVIGSKYAQFVLLAIQVDPMIRDSIVRDRNGKLFFRNRRIEVIDHFPFRRCNNCGSCKHFACSEKQERCLRCSGPHNNKACKAKTPCCPSCKGSHEAFDINCKVFHEEIERQMDKVDYTYTNILFAKGF